MHNKINLNIKGHILVTSNKNGVMYNEHNTIAPDALAILINCLNQRDYTKQIDSINVTGPGIGTVSRSIISSQYDPATNSITFRTVFYEFDFNGVIEELELKSNSFGSRVFATKDGLSIMKDSESRIQIDWKINIEIN